jgi:integrase
MAKTKKKEKKGFGYLYKRDAAGREHPATSKVPGRFWLAYRNDEGRRVRVRLEAATLDDAKAEQARLRTPVITQTKVDSLRAELGRLETRLETEADDANPPLTISDAWRTFEQAANRPECGEDTMRQHESNWQELFAWVRENMPGARFLRDITETVAGQYMTDFGRRKISANTYNKRIVFFRMFFRVLSKQARITENPFAEIAKRREQTHSRRELSNKELNDVLFTSCGELKRLFWIGYYTGLRLGDCCTLRWVEVDLEAGVIRRIQRKIKRRTDPVIIGISPSLARLLAAAEKKTGYVCPTYAQRYLKSRSEQTNISREIQAFLTGCGIETTSDVGNSRRAVEVGFHSLRHTYATVHAEKGTPQSVIQDNMGHASPAMTEHYQHVSEETARRAAAALDIPRRDEAANPARDDLRKIIETATDSELAALLTAWQRLKADNLVTNDREKAAEQRPD